MESQELMALLVELLERVRKIETVVVEIHNPVAVVRKGELYGHLSDAIGAGNKRAAKAILKQINKTT